jgi:hypothetical protein
MILNLNLPLRALYRLAAPSTPPELREEVLERAERGERISYREVVGRIAQDRLRSAADDLRRINGAIQSDLWSNRLPQLFGWTAAGIKTAAGGRIFQLAQKYLRTDVDIVKLILALSTLLSGERYWPVGQPKKWWRLLQRVYEDERVDALLQNLASERRPPNTHEEFFKQLLRDVAPRGAALSDPVEGGSR